jgi:hypothetical protein
MLLRSFIRVLPVLVAVAAVAFIWTLVARQPTSIPNRQGTPANSFLWGNRWFNDREDFAHWLHQRGAGYTRWANHHPQDIAALNGVFYPPRPAPHKQG